MMRTLITGASGFLGQYVARHLKDRHWVCGVYHNHPIALEGCPLVPLDIADEEMVRATFQEFHPDVVVHSAALSDVDRCEGHPDEALRVNEQGTAHVARAAAEVGARLIYISTDLVYDGTKGEYDEGDAARPSIAYGRSKLAGEQRAAEICRDAVILRVALIYGWGGAARVTFTDSLAERLRAGQEASLFIDQYRSPLFVEHGAEVIGRLIHAPEVQGVFNLGGGERVSRYEFGLKFCEVFDLPKERLKPVAMETFDERARRPRDCSMNSAKISEQLHVRPLTVEEGLQRMKRALEIASLGSQ